MTLSALVESELPGWCRDDLAVVEAGTGASAGSVLCCLRIF